MVPRLIANTLLANREIRRQQLVNAALTIALEHGVNSLTITEVAKQAGLSRVSVYEYFSSSADLITELLLDELDYFRNSLINAMGTVSDPYEKIEKWIRVALQYASDGRHMLVKSLAATTPPEFRREEVSHGHRALMATLLEPLKEMNLCDPMRAFSFLQNTIDSASIRIDSGVDVNEEVQQVLAYALAGLRGLDSLEISRRT